MGDIVFQTKGMCERCLVDVPASVRVSKSTGAVLFKDCPTHGKSEHLIDPDHDFYLMSRKQDESQAIVNAMKDALTTTGIDVTRRCNVQCPHCYVEPDNQVKDAPAKEIVNLARAAKRAGSIILMGAEPTMRNDLPGIISDIKHETGKTVGIYTNAIRLADEKYTGRLKNAGLDYACVSLHTPDYLGDSRLFDLKVMGISNLVSAGVAIHHISFSLQSLDELNGVLADAIKLRGIAGHIRIRSPQKIGVCEDEPVALSELFNRVTSLLETAGHAVQIAPTDNTPYHINLLVDGCQVIRLIRWPTLASADLTALDCPPYAIFDEESGEVNLVLSFLIQEAKRKAASNTEKTIEMPKRSALA